MPPIGKIAQSRELQNLVNDYHNKGLGYQAIADKLTEKGRKISFMAVKRYLDSIKDKKGEIISNDAELTNYVKNRIFDTGEQLKKANDALWDMIQSAQVSKTFKLSVIKQLLDTIKLADQMMNEFRGLNIKQTGETNTINLVQVVVDKLNVLEKRGDIKILNPKLRQGRENFEKNEKNIVEVEKNVESERREKSEDGGEGQDNDRQPSA